MITYLISLLCPVYDDTLNMRRMEVAFNKATFWASMFHNFFVSFGATEPVLFPELQQAQSKKNSAICTFSHFI
jgi:hypothetical protein